MSVPDDRDDYLWDRSGPVDPEVARLERLLAPKAWRAAPRAPAPALLARRPQPVRRRWRVAFGLAATLAALVIGGVAGYEYRLRWPAAQAWALTADGAGVRVDGEPVLGDATLAPGQVLETGVGTTARLQVGRIGEVLVGEDSVFELVETRSGRHRAQLREGRLWARIWAPPGSFGVGIPAGDVYDLGCEFVLHTRADGSGAITVRSGWVQVDNPWHDILVPEGTRLELGPHGEPGVPYALDAEPAFVAALRALDALGARAEPEGAEVRALLLAARPQDAISLLHLLQSQPQLAAGPVFDRMAQIMPTDALVTRGAVRSQGRVAYGPWWDALPYPRIKRWWLQWPDAFTATQEPSVLLHDGEE